MAGLSPTQSRPAFPGGFGSAVFLPFDPFARPPEYEPATTPAQPTPAQPDPPVYNTPVFVACPPKPWTGRFPSGGTVTVRSQQDSAATTASTGSVDTPPLTVPLQQRLTDVIAPGSVRFKINGRTYLDRDGDLVYDVDPTTNAGAIGGTIDYDTGEATITDWASGDFSVNIVGLGTIASDSPTNRLFFRTPAAPIAQASLTVTAVTYEDGTQIQSTADQNGVIDTANMQGFVDVETGIVEVFFGEWVTAAGNEVEWWYNSEAVEGGQIFKPHMIIPGSARFSCVVLTSIPLDPDILGLDPIMLPSDGRVPVFNPGDSLMLVQRNVVTDSSPSAGAVVNLGLENVSWVRVRDDNGEEVLSEKYTVDGVAGELKWATPLDLSAYTGPYEIAVLSYFKRLCSDVQIDGTISLASGAPFDMDTSDAEIYLASKLILLPDGGTQDLEAMYVNLFTQEGWNGSWSDQREGDPTTGAYDDVNFPIEMANNGSITERWRLQFIDSNTVNVIGERFGQVLTSVSIESDIEPINPATSTPYFSMKADGFSGGWSTGDVIRFNTLGANDPIWLIRSTQPGDSPGLPSDRFIAHLQGDVAQEED